MKIGILTFQNAHNYGALLQAYALKTYLVDKGYEVEIINYINKEIESEYQYNLKNKIKIGGIRSAKKWLKKQFSIIVGKRDYRIKWRKFDIFIKKYITSKQKIYTKEEIVSEQYDCIICGSDQIWNPYLTDGFDDIYFANLDSKVKKISYAASLGVSALDVENEKKFFEMLKNFDYISVREENLKKYIETNTGINTEIVLDPTLLLEKAKYDLFLQDVTYKNYILQYTLVDNPVLDSMVKFISKQLNLDIIELRYNQSFFRKNGVQICSAGIEDFLSLINNASFVITNSFHGTIFSILFEKLFYTVKINGVNSRIANLLQLTNLSERCIESIDDIKLDDEIDFRNAKKCVEEYKNNSEKFLNKVLNY